MPKLATFYDHMRDIARQENLFVTDAMKLAREMGVEALETSSYNILGREDEVGQELAMADMTISAIPATFNFGLDADVKTQAEPILEAVRFLGADKLMVIPGFVGKEDSPEARQAQATQMEECINRLADMAAGYGVSLIMEDFDSELAPFSTKEDLRRFLDHCPELSIAFDTGNFRYMAQDVLEAYDLLQDKITHVHLKDRAYTQSHGEQAKMAVDGVALYPCPVGGGDLPIDQVIARLKKAGYDGFYTIEHYDSNATLDYLRRSVAWVKEQLGL